MPNLISNPLTDARPGDVFLFNRNGVYNKLIRFKTWSRFTHCEVAVVVGGRVMTFTSRNGVGVNFYLPDFKGLALVLRPTCHFDQFAAIAWGQTVVGQPYDLTGLLAFWFAKYQGRDNGAQFCSEACTRYLRAGGAELFPAADADAIAPRDFSINPFLDVVWRSSDEWDRWLTANPQPAAENEVA